MKTTTRCIYSVLFAAIFLFIGFNYTTCFAQTNESKIKIGTYDSRIVFIAYTRSDYFKQQLMKNREEGNEILQSNDTVKKIEAFYKVMTEQYLAHQRGFSNGSTASILSLVKDKLPIVAKDSGVFVIVSQWELTYTDPAAEIVDLTMPIARLYNPAGDFETIASQLEEMAPIPLEELPMDEVIEMWKQFEIMYLGK